MKKIVIAWALVALGAGAAYGQDCQDTLEVAMLTAAQNQWQTTAQTLAENLDDCGGDAQYRYVLGVSLANASADSAAAAYVQLAAADSLNERAAAPDTELQQGIDQTIDALYAPLTNEAIGMLNTGNPEGARTRLEMALAINPSGKEALFAMGALHEMNQEWDPAIEKYEDALEIDPAFEPAVMKLGGLYEARAEALLAEGDVNAATELMEDGVEVYEEYLEENPDAFAVRVELATLYVQLGQGEAAAPIVQSVLEADTVSARTLTDVGFGMVNAGEDELAERLLERAVAESDTLWVEPIQYLAFVRMRQNDAEGAKEALEAQIAIDPSNAQAHEYYGAVLRSLGDEAGAREALGKAGSIPLDLRRVQLDMHPDRTWTATLTFANRLEAPVEEVGIRVHLVSRDGQVLETQETTLAGPLAPGQSAQVSVDFSTTAESPRIRHEIVS